MTAPEIRITGTLARNAESRSGANHTWWVCMEIHQAPDALPVAATKCIGSGASADLASKAMCQHLRRGAEVTVRAARYDIALRPSPHLVLVNVQHIDYRVPVPYQERAA